MFQPLGLVDISTIHSTWVEALVGTGLVGIVLLALSFFFTLARGVAEAARSRERILPVILLLVLMVRSLTGATFEAFQLDCLIFLWLAMLLRSPASGPLRA